MKTKSKPTLQERLAQRQFHIPSRAAMLIYKFLVDCFIVPKYHAHYTIKDNINDCKGPCFLIWNHQSRIDHCFLMEAAWPRRINILAGYNEFFRSHLAFLFKLGNIIPKKNYTEDVTSIRAISKIIKSGGCLTFSPEGMSSIYGQNQPIVPGTGRFLKFFGVPVYFCHLSGSYLTSTKICTEERSGKVDVELSLLFSPEQLQQLSAEEIQDKINEAFRWDDYAVNKVNHVRYKNKGTICTNLQDICYKCPKCGAELKMDAQKNYIKCEVCGNGATQDDYYDFHPYDDTCVIPESPNKWVEWERKEIIREIREDKNYSYSQKVKVGCLPKYHLIKHKKTSEPCGEGTFTIDHSGLHFVGTKFGEPWNWDLTYEKIYSLPVVTEPWFFSLYINREYHDFFPEERATGKMLLLTEEMHRLHVNEWKNFPWFDYLYEGMELPNK